MASPRISVVIPVHNRAEPVAHAIDSVLSQTFKDFELVAVDDGSTDNSVEVIDGFADSRVRLVKLVRNSGSNAARNAGIAAAQGDILCFLDSDDLFLPGKLEHVAKRFDKEPTLDVLVDSFVRMCSPWAGKPLVEVHNPNSNSTADFERALFTRELSKATSAISVRREAAVRAGAFDPAVKQRQDFDFLIRLAETANCASTSEILWIKGWSDDRLTCRERFIPATIALVERHPQYLTNRDYRGGLAKDITRNGYFLLRQGKWRMAFGGLAIAAGAFGVWRTAALVLRGTGQAVKRNVKRRRSSGAASKSFSPVEEQALATVRNRASGRS